MKYLNVFTICLVVVFICSQLTEYVESKNPTESIVESVKAMETATPVVIPEVTQVVETIEQKIDRIFGKDSASAKKVFTCESNLRPDAIGDTNTKYHSIGVAQIRLLPERNLTQEDIDRKSVV